MDPRPSSVYWRNSVMSTDTNNPKNVVEKFSNFGDDECGEPLQTQKVLIDFTPQEDVDTEFIQKKCCAFWEFIENCPELEGMKVLPQTETYPLPTMTTTDTTSVSGTVPPIPCEKTALSVLEFVNEKGMIDPIFKAKRLQSECSLGSREYQTSEPSTARPNESKLRKNKPVISDCYCTTPCKHCNAKIPARSNPEELDTIELQDWDKAHPKSFEPPRLLLPVLRHSNGLMQRNITPF